MMQIKEILKLIESVQQYDIQELEVSNEEWKVRITRRMSQAVPPHIIVDPAITSASAEHANTPDAASDSQEKEEISSSDRQLVEIVSPMVGTFYRASAPDTAPFVQVNDTVSPGQTVCIIEAMKLMNEIQTETRGRIAKILVENAQPVEYGQPLFLIEPV